MVSNASWSCAVHDGTLQIDLAGEIDCANADALIARVRLELEEVPAERLALDLGGVTFIDSTGVRVLLHAKQAIEARGGSFELRSLRPQAERLLEISGLGEHFRNPGADTFGEPWPRSSP